MATTDSIKKEHSNQSNGRKRKRCVSDHGTDSELLLKKRKLFNVNDLLRRIQVLTKQNKELKQETHDYKAKYLKLLKQRELTGAQEMKPIKTNCERMTDDPNDSTLLEFGSCSLEPSSSSSEDGTTDNRSPAHTHKPRDIVSISIAKEDPGANPENELSFDDSHYFSVACHRCSQHFDDVSEYRQHLRSHYGKKEEYQCDLDPNCTKVTSLYNFVHHIASHTMNYPWKCNQCDHPASTKGNLKQHWKRAHQRRKKKKRNGNKLPDSAPVILCSALTAEQRSTYERFKKEFEDTARFVSKWNENVTHLVTPAVMKEDAILLATTMKYYQSVVAGCWVLCFDWVQQCLANDQLCNESPHQIREDRIARDGCRKAREMRQNKDYKGLFANVTVFIASALKHTKLDDGLRALFMSGGAEVMRISILDITETHTQQLVHRNMVFVYDKTDHALTTAQQLVCHKFAILPIGFQQVFDAISNYTTIDKRPSNIIYSDGRKEIIDEK